MPSNRHVPKALEDLSIKLLQDNSVFMMGEKLAPTKRVGKITDQYYRYNTAEQYMRKSTVRADKTRAKSVALVELTQSTYTLRNHALRVEISDIERQNADPAVDPEVDALQEITSDLLRDRELEVSANFFTSTSYTTNLLTLSTNAYDRNTTTSTPIEDARTAYRAILRNSGQPANGLAMGQNTFDVLIDHSDVLDRIKWSSVANNISQELLATTLGVDNVYVSKAVFNDSRYGLAASMTFIFNAALLYFYNTPNPGRRSANLGIGFSGFYGDAMPQVSRFREEDIKSDVVELNWMYSPTLVNSLAGYFIAVAHA